MTNSAPPPPGGYQPVQPMNPSDEKLWSTLVHVGGIFFSFIPALIGYLVLKDRGPFVRAHTQTALNFQISVIIYSIVLTIFSVITIGLGALLFIPFGIAILVFMILAAVKANTGEYYKYPLTIEFIK
jgi:uncharacterized Tic20 family protein